MIPENFATHQVFEKLKQLQQSYNAENAKVVIQLADMAFFDAAYKYIIDRLKYTVPILVQEAELNALSSEIDAATGQINSFVGNNNAGHINNAINNLNSAFNRIRNFPFPLSKGDFDFSKSIASFQQTAQTGYENIKAINEKSSQDLATLQANIETNRAQLATIEQKLAAKETEIQNVLIRYNTEIETLKTAVNTDAETDRKKINADIEADRKLYKELFDADAEKNQKLFEEQNNEVRKQSTTIVNSLNSKLEEANKIVNIVGNVGVTGNYQNIANENMKAANLFRGIALAFMVIMSGLLIWSIIEISKNGEFNLYKSLVRILAAAVLTYPAVYAARESSRHRQLETQNRKLELELASIGPFIELLPEDKKQKIKEELVNRYFGNNNSLQPNSNNENDDVPINSLDKILKTILPYVKK